MKLRKEVVVGGALVLVVGTLLLMYGFLFPPLETLLDDMDTIQSDMYRYYWVRVPSGGSVHAQYTTSDEVEFHVFDSHNFELFATYADCDEMYAYIGRSKSYTFRAPEDDRYYFVLMNIGYGPVNSFVKLSREPSWTMFIWIGGVSIFVIGFVGLIVGLTLKSKMGAIPQHHWLQPNARARRRRNVSLSFSRAILLKLFLGK